MNNFDWKISNSGSVFNIKINKTHEFNFDSSIGWIYDWISKKCSSETIHEPAMSKLIYQFSIKHPKMVFFDIGAYLGFFSLLALSTSKGNMTVKSFEMNPKSCDFVNININKNKHLDLQNIEVVRCALSDINIQKKLTKHTGFNILDDEADIETRYSESELEFITLDSYCSLNGLTPDLIKLDVEGYEWKIIKGANSLFSENKPTLLLELHSNKMLEQFGVNRLDVLEELLGFGYKAFYVGNHRINDLKQVNFESLEPLTALENKLNYGADDLFVFTA